MAGVLPASVASVVTCERELADAPHQLRFTESKRDWSTRTDCHLLEFQLARRAEQLEDNSGVPRLVQQRQTVGLTCRCG